MHCHSSILNTVKQDAAATAEARRNAVAAKDIKDIARNKDMLLDYFPAIPKDAAAAILSQ